MPMLTQDDLKAIGTIVEEKVLASEGRIETKLDELEESMNIKFDAVHEELEAMENRLVSKSYLDEKLAFYVKKTY